MDCIGCRSYKNLGDNHCIGCNGSGYTKQSNADHIRAMTDEELARFISVYCVPFPPSEESVFEMAETGE